MARHQQEEVTQVSAEETKGAEPTEKLGGVETFGVKSPAKDGKPERSLSVSFDFGTTLEEATTKFGPEAIFSGFIASAKVDAQAFLRRRLSTPKKIEATETTPAQEIPYTDEEIMAEFASWKPGTKTRGTADPLAKIMGALGKLTDEQKKELLASLA